MARTHFSGPIRVGDDIQVVASGGKNDNASAVIRVNGDIVDTSSNIVFDYSDRAIAVSNITVGVSGTDTKITAIRVYSATIGSGSIGANSVILSSYTVTGIATGDKLFVIPPTSGISSGGGGSQLGIAYAIASAADTVAIGWLNPTAAANVHVTGTYTIVAIRS